jgi:DnaJ-domain-containing protein 1
MVRFIILLVVAYFIARAVQKLFAPSPAAPKPRVDPPRPPPRTNDGERSPHEVLGVRADASPEEIRTAYQRLMRENHPDRVADMSQEIRDVAERRSKEINQAYDRLKRA